MSKKLEGGPLVVRGRRSMRYARETLVSIPRRALVLACLGLLAVGAGQASAAGPAPDPAPPRSGLRPQAVRPGVAPRKTREPAPSTSRGSTPSSSSSSRGVQVTPTGEGARSSAGQSSRTAKSKPTSRRTTLKPPPPAQVRQRRSAGPATPVTPSTSLDSRLLRTGGLLLVALVLGDALFLALSARLAVWGRDDE